MIIIIGDTTTPSEIITATKALLALIPDNQATKPAPIYTTGTDETGTDIGSAFPSHVGASPQSFEA